MEKVCNGKPHKIRILKHEKYTKGEKQIYLGAFFRVLEKPTKMIDQKLCFCKKYGTFKKGFHKKKS